ncbi:hypothetical protein ACA910_006838 [Epithemia clementina (nom. ined.)]
MRTSTVFTGVLGLALVASLSGVRGSVAASAKISISSGAAQVVGPISTNRTTSSSLWSLSTPSHRDSDKGWYLPYVVTCIGTRSAEDDNIVSFSRDSHGHGVAYILENPKLAHNSTNRGKTFQGKILYSSDGLTTVDRFVEGVMRLPKLFAPLDDHRPLLFYIHGFSVTPEGAIEACAKYNARKNRKFIAVPIIWDTTHFALAYKDDRKTLAPQAAETFGRSFGRIAQLFPLFMSHGPKKYLMCHSMGNYILQGFAQSHRDSQATFEDIFMVASDVRQDIFDTEINNHNETSKPEYLMAAFANNVAKLVFPSFSSSSDFDSIANPGKDIASLARNKVHVLWSKKDKALLARRLFQKSARKVRRATTKFMASSFRNALGRKSPSGNDRESHHQGIGC